jgi:hypothetical protein
MKELAFDTPASSFADYAPLPAEEGVEPTESASIEAPIVQVGLSIYTRDAEGNLVLDESCKTLASELNYSQRVAYDAADTRRSIGRYNADGTVTPFAVQYNVQTLVK